MTANMNNFIHLQIILNMIRCILPRSVNTKKGFSQILFNVTYFNVCSLNLVTLSCSSTGNVKLASKRELVLHISLVYLYFCRRYFTFMKDPSTPCLISS